MTPNFKTEFAEILEIDESDVTGDIVFDESRWDSLAIVSTMALIDEEYSKIVDPDKLKNCKSVKDLMDLVHSS